MAFEWLTTLIPYIIIILVVAMFFKMIAEAVGLDKLLALFVGRRRKPLEMKREDYDALMVRDLKRSAARNRVPAKWLYMRDPKDEEHPSIVWGKVKGVNAETDVAHILVRRRWNPFHELLFVPKDCMSDLHSKELYVFGVGARVVNRYYWVPIWGARFSSDYREKLNKIIWVHMKVLWDQYRALIGLEEGTAQMVSAMEPSLVHGRQPIQTREPELVAAQEKKGEEVLE